MRRLAPALLTVITLAACGTGGSTSLATQITPVIAPRADDATVATSDDSTEVIVNDTTATSSPTTVAVSTSVGAMPTSPRTTTAEPVATSPVSSGSGSAQDPLLITDPALTRRLSSSRVDRLDLPIPLGSAMLSAPTGSPNVSVDQAYATTGDLFSRYSSDQTETTFNAVLADYGHDAGDPEQPDILVYDFIVNGASCHLNGATTAPPGAPPPLPTPCTLHDVVDANSGTLLFGIEVVN